MSASILSTDEAVCLNIRGDSSVYSRVEHLARSIWLGKFDWANRMAMYSAYFDESGHPDDSPYVVVAGCVADVAQWVRFERDWTSLLNPFGTRVFHMVDFHNRKKPFDKLTDPEADELLMRLAGVICLRVEKTISQILTMAEYNATNERYVFAECYGFPYPMLARSCMGQVGEWASRHSIPESEILYFFEDGAKHKGQLRWIAERDGLTQPQFLSKNEAVPLQAGDFIAWCLNLHTTENGNIPTIYDKVLDRLSSTSPVWGRIRMSDPDRLPTILQIPKRDPAMQYHYRILRHSGKRLPTTHYWPKHKTAPKLIKKKLKVAERPVFTLEAAMKAMEEYELKKRGTIQS